MFDLAHTACQKLLGDDSTAMTALLEATIAAPLTMQAADEKIVICDVQPSKGLVQVQSQANSSMRQVHLKAASGDFPSPSPSRTDLCSKLFM